MARDGTGNYVLPAGQPVVTGTIIDSSIFNTLTADLAAALTNSIAKDGQTTVTANLPMGTFKHTGVAAGTARDQYGTVAQLIDGAPHLLGSVAGTANAITANLTPAIPAYTAGMIVFLPATNDNTGACTLAINGLAAKAILRVNYTNPIASDIQANCTSMLWYDLGNTTWILLNPINGVPAKANQQFTYAGGNVITAGSSRFEAHTFGIAATDNLVWSSSAAPSNALTPYAYFNGSNSIKVGFINTTGGSLTDYAATFTLRTLS